MLRKLIMTGAALTACILLTAATPAPAAAPMAAPVKAPVAAAVAPMAPAAPVMAAVPADVPTMAATPAAPTKVAPGKPDSTGSVIGGALLQILIVILMVAIPIILTPVVKWLLKKMKVEDLQTQLMVDGIVDQGVVHGLNYANEQAYKLRDNPVASAAKLSMATDKTLAYLKDSGIVDKGASYIEDLIEAKLGQTRYDDPENKPAESKSEDETAEAAPEEKSAEKPDAKDEAKEEKQP